MLLFPGSNSALESSLGPRLTMVNNDFHNEFPVEQLTIVLRLTVGS